MDAQELRLQEALNSLEAAKTRVQGQEAPSADDGIDQQMSSSWDMLERIVGLEGDLLSSYREYTRELEKRTKKEEKQQVDC